MVISKNLISLNKVLVFFLLSALLVSVFLIPAQAALASTVKVTITPEILAQFFEDGQIIFQYQNQLHYFVDYQNWWIDKENDIIWFYPSGTDTQLWGGLDYQYWFEAWIQFAFNFRYLANTHINFYSMCDSVLITYFTSADVILYNESGNVPLISNSGSKLFTPSNTYGDGVFEQYNDIAVDPGVWEYDFSRPFDVGTDEDLCNRMHFSQMYLGDVGEGFVGYGSTAFGIGSFEIMIDAKDNPNLGSDAASIVAYLNQLDDTLADVNSNIEYQNQKIDEIIDSLNTSTPEQDNVVSDFQSGADKYIGDLTSAADFESEVIDGFESFFGDYTDFDEIYGPWPESDVGNVAPPELDNFIGHKVIGVIFSVVAICALLHTLVYGRW